MTATGSGPTPARVRTGAGEGATAPIGEAARRAGVSPRTLRYYEELGLLAPSGHSAGGARRYSETDVARLLRIRELQELLGFDLGAIGEVLRAEDELADLRRRFHRDADAERRHAILAEAIAINARLRSVVRAKQERLNDMMRDLESKARRYRTRAREIDGGPGAGPGPEGAAGTGGSAAAAGGAPTSGVPARRGVRVR